MLGDLIACPAGIIEDGSGAPTGTPMSDPPLIEMISEDPVLRNTKLISEAWDCDGLFQVWTRLHRLLSRCCPQRLLPGIMRRSQASSAPKASYSMYTWPGLSSACIFHATSLQGAEERHTSD